MRRRVRHAAAGAAPAIAVGVMPHLDVSCSETQGNAEEDAAELLAMLSHRCEIEFRDTLKESVEASFGAWIDSLELFDDTTVDLQWRIRNYDEDGDGRSPNYPHLLVLAENVPVPMLCIGERCRRIEREHKGLPAYLMHLLLRAPFYIMTPAHYIEYSREEMWWRDNQPQGIDDEFADEELPTVDRLQREFPEYLRKHVTDYDASRIPVEIREHVIRLRDAVDALQKLPGEDITGLFDLPLASLHWRKDFLGPSRQIIDEIGDDYNNSGEGMFSPYIFPCWLEENFEDVENALKAYFSAKSAACHILAWISTNGRRMLLK